jgi:flagellar protein FlaG
MTNDVRLHPALPPVRAATAPRAVASTSRAEARAFESVSRLLEPAEHGPEGAPVARKDLAELVEELSGLVQSIRRELQFSVDQESGRTVIKVVDSESGELIRQIPPEEVLTLVGRFKEEQAGLLREQA